MHRFRYGLLACAAFIGLTAMSPPASATVRIDRDEFGVPKITADTDAEMWFAFGFAQARDRLIQLEIMRQEAYGKLPKVSNVDATGATKRQTRNWRRLHLFPNLKNSLITELEKFADEDEYVESVLGCFTQGIQAFKDVVFHTHSALPRKCNVSPENMHGLATSQAHDLTEREASFIQHVFLKQKLPTPDKADFVWEPVDSLALFHLRVMHEFSMRNTEMKNLKLLHDLYKAYTNDGVVDMPPGERAARMFNSIKWALHPNAKTTIPVADEHERQEPTRKALEYHRKLASSGDPRFGINPVTADDPLRLNGCSIYNPDLMSGILEQTGKLTAHNVASPFPLNASNWWVISQPGDREEGGISRKPNSLLYNGPQISAIDPSHTYQVALVSHEGPQPFTFAGNAYIGSPNFWQGHNGTMAFGLTAGNIDVSDVFCVPVTKGEDGKWGYREGRARKVFNDILTDSGELKTFTDAAKAYANPRQFGEVLENMYTVGETGWPVLAIDKKPAIDGATPSEGTAYILLYNWQDRTASTIYNWLRATQAKSLEEWNQHLDEVAGNFNLSAVHQNGAFGYRLTGALPIKAGMKTHGDPRSWNYFPVFDPRLPAPLYPEAGWPDRIVNHELQITNGELKQAPPGQAQFIANWNQKPFINMPDGDLDYDAYTPYDRAFIIERLLEDHKGSWSQRDVQEMNGRLQRMDVNYIIFKPFLTELTKSVHLDLKNKIALRTMLSWDGKRGDYRKGDVRGLHKGHVLFYYWLENMADQFKYKIAGLESGQQLVRRSPTEVLISNLSKGQMKLKQPKLSWEFEENIRVKQSTETSHNIHLGSRIILQALHATIGQEKGDDEKTFSERHGFPEYRYDKFQHPLIRDHDEANRMIIQALGKAVDDARKNGWNITLEEGEDPYLASGSATFSGLSKTLGLNDTQIGFRPGDPLEVKHFRNRGALNIVVGLWSKMVHGANVSSPGIREYRGYPTPATEQERLNDWSLNQLYLFRDNEYRPMHDLSTKRDDPDAMRMGEDDAKD